MMQGEETLERGPIKCGGRDRRGRRLKVTLQEGEKVHPGE